MRILVTGATGYIGGRLIPRLLSAGHEVVVLVRAWDSVHGRAWEKRVSVVRGDLLDPGSFDEAVKGIDAGFYLVHSMYAGRDFAARDRAAAEHFVAAVRRTADQTPNPSALPHILYLGGLRPRDGATRSGHLRSRAEVGRVLAEGLPGRVTEFRAGPIIGSGSASFEMVRYLTERLPVMVTPRWVNTRVQPVAVRDVLAYLEAALEHGEGCGVVDIGGDVLTFKAMMYEVARQRGLWRCIIPTPVLAPKLAARWVGFVTPIPNALAVPLVEGVTQPLLADTRKAQQLFPQVSPISYADAVDYALGKVERGEVETRWSGAGSGVHTPADAPRAVDTVIEHREGLARDQRTLVTDVPPEHVFAAICRIGGAEGWYAYTWAWWLRGVVDALLGGPGLRRGRRDPKVLYEGEALDWWRVERVEPPGSSTGLLRLRAEMRLPGRAWLQWEVDRDGGCTVVRQAALFEPRGLPGTIYWNILLPAHHLIFPALLRELETRARRLWRDQDLEAGVGADDQTGAADDASATRQSAPLRSIGR